MSDAYSDLDATSQADLVRKKKVSPRELVDAAIARIEKLNPKLNAVIIPLFEKARALADSPRPSRWAVPRRALPAEGPGVRECRRPESQRHAILEEAPLRGAGGQHHHHAVSRRRARHRRPDEHSRARARRYDRAARVRAGAQPLESGALDGRIERGQRGLRGRPSRTRGERERRGRLDPHPGERMRDRRPQADPWPDLAGSVGRRVLARAGDRRRRQPFGTGLRGATRRDRGTDAGRPVFRAAPAAAVRRRGRPSPGQAPHRAHDSRAHQPPATSSRVRESRGERGTTARVARASRRRCPILRPTTRPR